MTTPQKTPDLEAEKGREQIKTDEFDDEFSRNYWKHTDRLLTGDPELDEILDQGGVPLGAGSSKD